MASAQTLRRDLHAQPELSWEEKATAELVRAKLSALNIPWEVCADTGTIARLNQNSKNDHPHIALRADIDALPIKEANTFDWCSTQSGKMHACGHDGHTATLLGTAAWLKQHETQLPGKVTLLFQPAEEGGHGAREMIKENALKDIDEIYGWHNWPAIPFGKMACPDDIVMCGNATFIIKVIGKGGHASQPELCKDPVLAASAITLNLQQIVSRHLPPQASAVVSVTSIEAPSGATVIPEQALIGGSIRFSDNQTRDLINSLIKDITQLTARAYGVECEVNLISRYDATINHSLQAKRMRDVWQEYQPIVTTDDNIRVPIMASEDFHYYLKEIPGAFALIGADDGNNHHIPCHSQHYDFNDRLIPLVSRLYCSLVGAPLAEF